MPEFDVESVAKQNVQLRDFRDIGATREAVLRSVEEAYKNKTIEDDNFALRFLDVGYRNPRPYTKRDEKSAVMKRRSLTHPLVGRLQFIDKRTGQVVSEDEKPRSLAQVPYMTSSGLFIDNGSQYSVSNQSRLRPGVYTRRKQNGILETQFNIIPGTGRGFRLNLEPETGLFRIHVGQSNVKLYPLLKDLGIKDEQLEEVWGRELLNINRAHDDKEDKRVTTRKILDKLGNYADRTAASPEEVKANLNAVFNRMELDPEVTRRTLGKEYTHVGVEPIVHATDKLLSILRNKPGVHEDSRDSLVYQKFYSPEDFFKEHVDKDAGKLQKAIFNKLKYFKDTKKIPNNYFTKQLRSVLIGSGLAAAIQQMNPLEAADLRSKVTRMGEGGMGSTDAVDDAARDIHPSQFGFIDAIRTPESIRLGLDQRLASGVLKGSDNKIYQQVLDRNTGEKKIINVEEFADNPIAFPGEDTRVEHGGVIPKKIRVMHNGKIKYMNREEVPYSLDVPQRMFSPITHFIPMFSATKAQRTLMGTRMQSQALPLVEAEAPYVQTRYLGGNSVNRELAEEAGAVFSDSEGVVVKVDPSRIVIRKPDGTRVEKELYEHLPYNQKSFIHNEPSVKVGQKVSPGQLLARSNYTDAEGNIALGRNALVGYHMMDGMTHEDAIVISESAARKFATQRMYNTKVERGDRVKDISKSKYVAKYGGKFNKRQLDTITNEGVVKPGTTVYPGDPLILAVGEVGKKVQSSLGKSQKTRFIDSAEVWEHDEPGIVTDVDKTSRGWNVSVKSQDKVKVADKLSNFHGGKGVVSKVVPDDEMLHTEEGEPLDLVLNPTGVIGRVNPSQIAESALGKVAHKTGKRYVIDPFSDKSFAEMAWKELKKHGLKDKESLYDPKKDRAIPNVFTGRQYFVNLHHLASSKLGARSTAGYTMEGLPAKGGPEGAKRLDTLGLFALLSSGATETIKDAKKLRGQRNDEYWKLFRLGFRPPEPSESLSNTKLENSLIAAGVNVRKKGTRTQILPLIDKDIDKMAGSREITVPDTVDFNSMENVEGGLFDVALTGGQNGTKWSYIGLSEPLPNPIMETPIKLLLNINKKKFEDVISGQDTINGYTGGSAIKNALSKLNIDREVEATKEYLRSGKKTERDKKIKKLGILDMLKKTGIQPDELVMSKVPVLPPVFRPVTKMEGVQLVDDANYLYKELMEANENVKQYKEEFGDTLDTQTDLYKTLKAVMGLGDPLSRENQERGVRGILKKALGRSPKMGLFQRKVLTANLDLVGRGVIVPNPELDIDEVGIPEKMAWETFKPFVVRRLVKNGMKAEEAFKEWENRGPRASKVLLDEMKERPVVVNRAPSWHKFNMTGHIAHPVAGDSVELPIPILAGLGGDFDGDTVQVHVPVSEESKDEIKDKLFPSKMLYSPKTYSVQMKPEHAFMTGIFLGSGEESKKIPKIFDSEKEAIKAYKRGDLEPTDPVIIRKT